MAIPNNVGEILIQKRMKKNLSQQDVALRAGISRPFYTLIEQGKKRPSPEVAQRLGLILGIGWTIFYTP